MNRVKQFLIDNCAWGAFKVNYNLHHYEDIDEFLDRWEDSKYVIDKSFSWNADKRFRETECL